VTTKGFALHLNRLHGVGHPSRQFIADDLIKEGPWADVR